MSTQKGRLSYLISYRVCELLPIYDKKKMFFNFKNKYFLSRMCYSKNEKSDFPLNKNSFVSLCKAIPNSWNSMKRRDQKS